MNLKSSVLSRELKSSLWIIFVLTLIFGFNDGRDSFVFSSWIHNFFNVFVVVAITIIAHAIGAKLSAGRLGQEAELKLLKIERIKFSFFGFRVEKNLYWDILGFKIKGMPIGAIIGFLMMIISKGTFYFTAVSTIIVRKIPRLGKGFELHESKEALIYSSALIANLILIILFNYFNYPFGVVVNIYFVLWNLLPIPGLLGSKIFFNNKPFYIFFLVFAALFLLLFTKLNLVFLVIFSAVVAFLAMILWVFKKEHKSL